MQQTVALSSMSMRQHCPECALRTVWELETSASICSKALHRWRLVRVPHRGVIEITSIERTVSSNASRPSPFLLRLHPHATGWVVHHVHQPSGITSILGPSIARWPLWCSGRGVKTVHLLLHVENGGLRGRRVLSLALFNHVNVVQNAPIFSSGFGVLLSHIWSLFIRSRFSS